MALVFEILLGVVILASFYVAYMSAKAWPVYQAILVAFIFLGTVTFFYLAARTLATHNAWGAAAKRMQNELESVEKQTAELNRGGPVDDKGQPNPRGIVQLREDLYKLAVDRGGALFDVEVEGVKDGTVQLAFKAAGHGLVPKTVLFAFDQTPFEEGGRYQGEFKVDSVSEDGTKVQVSPNLPLNEAQTQRLAAAKGPWTLYTTMPIDDGALFAGIDEPTRRALVPPASLQEYASADRKLRDYEYLFHEDFVQRSMLADGISELNSNIQRTTADAKQTDEDAAYRATEKGNLQADLEKFRFESKAITQYRQTLETVFQQARESLRTRFAENKRMAAQLTAAQLKAAREIDQRTAPPAAPN
jgi:hypothetical protein